MQGPSRREGAQRVARAHRGYPALIFFEGVLTNGIQERVVLMQTYPLNALAEQFEVDRSTMVKAMRDVPADLVKPGNRPT